MLKKSIRALLGYFFLQSKVPIFKSVYLVRVPFLTGIAVNADVGPLLNIITMDTPLRKCCSQVVVCVTASRMYLRSGLCLGSYLKI